MRRLGLATLVLTLAWWTGNATRADDKSDARAVIDKAIKAAGGEAKLEKWKASTWKEKGIYYGMGNGLPYVGEYAAQFPTQFRMEIENVFMIVVNGDNGWMKANNQTMDMSKEQVAAQKEEMYTGWVSHLTPLTDKSYALALIGDDKVNDRPVIGVKVSSKGHRDVDLFFDKETGLLAKTHSTVKDMEQGGKEVSQDVVYTDYKEVNGIKAPMKVLINREGKKYVEAELSDLKALDKLEDSVFAKP